jgi:hypothetical protein
MASHSTTQENTMKDMSYYATPTTKYPDRQDYETTYYYKGGVCIASAGVGIVAPRDYSVKETVLNKEAYKKHEKQYYSEKNKLEEEFKQDLFEELSIVNNPKRDLLYSKAYESGHSGGLSNVFSVASDLVDLIN